MFTSKFLQCKDCGQEFEFTPGEQQFYAEKGFTNEPSRCPSCRRERKNSRNRELGGGYAGQGYRQQSRPMYETTCDGCGQVARVPFQPDGSKPVYCSECYRASRRYAQ